MGIYYSLCFCICLKDHMLMKIKIREERSWRKKSTSGGGGKWRGGGGEGERKKKRKRTKRRILGRRQVNCIYGTYYVPHTLLERRNIDINTEPFPAGTFHRPTQRLLLKCRVSLISGLTEWFCLPGVCSGARTPQMLRRMGRVAWLPQSTITSWKHSGQVVGMEWFHLNGTLTLHLVNTEKSSKGIHPTAGFERTSQNHQSNASLHKKKKLLFNCMCAPYPGLSDSN